MATTVFSDMVKREIRLGKASYGSNRGLEVGTFNGE